MSVLRNTSFSVRAVYVKNSKLKAGDTLVPVQGDNGLETMFYWLVYRNGRELIYSSEELQYAVVEIDYDSGKKPEYLKPNRYNYRIYMVLEDGVSFQEEKITVEDFLKDNKKHPIRGKPITDARVLFPGITC